MSTLFTLLLLFCLCAIVIGLLSPQVVIRWKVDPTRSEVFKWYGSGIVISFIMVALLSSPDIEDNSKKITTPAVRKNIQQKIPPKKINVAINFATGFKKGNFFISGTTNLPNGTILMISLNKNGGYGASSKVSVKNNTFTSEGFSNKGTPLTNGTYELNISTPLARLQPATVQKIIGENAKNLQGNFIVHGSDIFKNDNFVELTAKFEVSTSLEPQKDGQDLLVFLQKFELLYQSLNIERKKSTFSGVWSHNWNSQLNDLRNEFGTKFGANLNEYKGECSQGFFNIAVGAGYLRNIWSEQNALFSGHGKMKILNNMERYTNEHFSLAKKEIEKCE